MKANHPWIACLLFALLAPCLHAENTPANSLDGIDLEQVPVVNDKQVTADDLSAISKFESGEIINNETGKYTEEEVNTFLEQFVGTWEGRYAIATMEGKQLRVMDAQVSYEWSTVGETRVLKNRSVYATDDNLSYSTSLSYFWLGRLVSEVEQEGIKRIYLGRISAKGDSVSWNVANAQEALRSSTRESFQTEDGTPAILIRGYEEQRKDLQVVYLDLKGELKRTK